MRGSDKYNITDFYMLCFKVQYIYYFLSEKCRVNWFFKLCDIDFQIRICDSIITDYSFFKNESQILINIDKTFFASEKVAFVSKPAKVKHGYDLINF